MTTFLRLWVAPTVAALVPSQRCRRWLDRYIRVGRHTPLWFVLTCAG